VKSAVATAEQARQNADPNMENFINFPSFQFATEFAMFQLQDPSMMGT